MECSKTATISNSSLILFSPWFNVRSGAPHHDQKANSLNLLKEVTVTKCRGFVCFTTYREPIQWERNTSGRNRWANPSSPDGQRILTEHFQCFPSYPQVNNCAVLRSALAAFRRRQQLIYINPTPQIWTGRYREPLQWCNQSFTILLLSPRQQKDA